MDDVVIPGWAVALFTGVLIPWVVWLTLRLISTEKAIAVNTNNDVTVGKEIQSLNQKVDSYKAETKLLIADLKRDMEINLDKMDKKVDKITDLLLHPRTLRK